MRSILNICLCLSLLLCACMPIHLRMGGRCMPMDPELIKEISTMKDVAYIERPKYNRVYTVKLYWSNDVFCKTTDYPIAIYIMNNVNIAWERSTLQERIMFITQ